MGARRNVLLLFGLAFLLTASHGSMELAFPLNLKRLGDSLPVIGFTVGLIYVGSLGSRLPAGAWYRPEQGRLLIAGSLAAMGLSTVGLAVTDSSVSQGLLAGAHGAAYGLASTFMLALLIDEVGGGSRTAGTMAWYTAAISTGYAAGYPAAGLLIQHLGYAPAFWASGLTGVAAGIMALGLAGARLEHESAAARPGFLAGLRAVPGLPATVFAATLLVFYINFISDSLNAFFPIFAVSIGITVAAVGFMKSVNSIAATGIRFTAAAVFRFVRAGPVNHAAVLAMAAGVVGISVFTNQLLLAAMFGVLGVARGLIRVTSATMIADERARLGSGVGMASAFYNAGLDLGSLLAPPVTGFLGGLIGIPATFRVVAVALPVLYYVLWLRQRLRRAPEPAQVGA